MQQKNALLPKDFGQRLRWFRNQRNLTQLDLGKAVDRQPTSISEWEKGESEPTLEQIGILAGLLGVSTARLAFGDAAGAVQEAADKYGEPVRYVPVVSWTHAGEAVAYEQIPLHDQERVATMCTDPRAFAITVEGESMLPDFKTGARVIVAPSRDSRNGKPCVTKLADDGVILRLFHRVNAGTIRLSSLRPEIYPGLDLKPGEFRWCWPVEELNRKV